MSKILIDEATVKQVLEALEKLNNTNSYWWQEVDEAVVAQLSSAETALREALAEQPTPTGKTLYWDADDGESGPSHDIESLLNNVASNGDLEVGAEVHIVRALELPDMRVRVTKVPEDEDIEDEDIEYEVITKGNT